MKSTNIKNFSSKGNDDDDVIHERIASGSKNKFKCACGKVYDYRTSLTSHILNKNNNSFPCPHCLKVLLTGVGLRKHLDNQVCTKDISDDDDDGDGDDDKVNDISCPNCDKIFKSNRGLKYHLSHRVCYDEVDDDSDEDTEDGVNVVHKRVECSDRDKFKCACGRVYQNEEKFLHHLRYGTFTFPCANCGCKEFTTQRSLDEHLLSYKCKGTASGRADDNNVNDYEPPVTVSNANSSSSSSSRNIQSSATSASAKGG